MKEVSIIGVDLAKLVFQLYGATEEGEVVFRKKLSRKRFLAFMQAIHVARLQWKPALLPIIGPGRSEDLVMTCA